MRFDEIVGVAGDAAVVCVPCATRIYGEQSIDWLVAIHPDKPIDALNGIGPTDNEGNVLTPIFAGSDDALDIDAEPTEFGEYPPARCMSCGRELL